MSENETTPENEALTKESAKENAEGKEAAQAVFALERIYVKDTSFESPNSPDIFKKQWKPEVKMDLFTKNKQLGDELYEIVVCTTLTATVDGMTAYIAEVQQAGIFTVQGLQGMQLAQALSSYCPNILFPYLREAMDTIIVKGSFSPAMMAPVNFDAIFANAVMQKKKQVEDAASAEAEDSTAH